VARALDGQVLIGRGPEVGWVARGDGAVGAVPAAHRTPAIGAVPPLGAIVLAGPQREVRGGRIGEPMIELSNLEGRIVIIEAAAAIERAPHPAVASDDEPIAGPREGVVIHMR